MTSRSLLFLAAAAAFALAPLALRAAEPMTLKYGNPTPARTTLQTKLVEPWARQVTRESKGTLDVQVFGGGVLVNMRNAYDRVLNGVADLALCVLGPISSQFPKTLVATLPFEAENAHEAGLALQHLYAKGIIDDEWQKVKPIAFGVFANITLHTVPDVRTLDQLSGLKIAVQGRLAGETIEALGGTPISLPSTDVYQALQRGTVQGVILGWPGTVAYKLTDIAKRHVQASLGGESAMMIMNLKSYDRLTGAAKKAIDDHIGTVYTNVVNKFIDDNERAHIDIVSHQKGQNIYRLTKAQQTVWKKRIEPVIKGWVARTPNGPAVLAAFRKEIAAIRAGS